MTYIIPVKTGIKCEKHLNNFLYQIYPDPNSTDYELEYYCEGDGGHLVSLEEKIAIILKEE